MRENARARFHTTCALNAGLAHGTAEKNLERRTSLVNNNLDFLSLSLANHQLLRRLTRRQNNRLHAPLEGARRRHIIERERKKTP